MTDHSKSSPLPTYFAVWAALLLGTFLTYQIAKVDLGVFNAAVALIIATTKALLVALFFMHLKGASERLLKLVVISTLFFLALLLVLSMADYATRHPYTSWNQTTHQVIAQQRSLPLRNR